MLVQSGYTIRVWRLSSRNKTLTGIIILLIAGAFAIGALSTILRTSPLASFRSPAAHIGSSSAGYSNVATGYTSSLTRLIQLLLTTTCDLSITFSLVYHLRAHRLPFFAHTQKLMHRLLVYCIATGLATSLYDSSAQPLSIFLHSSQH
ncbi:hypothetical protein HGRIS_004114 [Hohenbuehelia grisea]|uniref:DUF6534 domain-containing protein n=1 Tax=Hohenbuehelia grisea TaxID=104357 RepID=A0ABR3JJ90_9AGAR